MKVPTNSTKAIFALLACLVAYGLLGESQYQDELVYDAHKCEMYQLYIVDKIRGLPPERRSGYPITMEKYQDVCL